MSCVTHVLFLTKITISLWNQPGRAAPKPRQRAGDIAQQLRLLQVLKTCFVLLRIWFRFVLHVLTEKMDTFAILGYSHSHLLESLNTQFCCKTNKPAVCNSCGSDMSREPGWLFHLNAALVCCSQVPPSSVLMYAWNWKSQLLASSLLLQCSLLW